MTAPNIEEGGFYTAELFYTEGGYRSTPHVRYYLTAGKTHAIFYSEVNAERKVVQGCFPLSWFRDFRPAERPDPVTAPPDDPDEDDGDKEQIALF